PNRSGFAKNCRQLNPKLPQKLVERIAVEQVKRFRKLQENFNKHYAQVQTAGCCTNKNQCGALTGNISNQVKGEPMSAYDTMHFSISQTAVLDQSLDYDDSDEDGEGVASSDGKVTPAQF